MMENNNTTETTTTTLAEDVRRALDTMPAARFVSAADVRSAIAAAFRELRRDGYFARMNWQCCSSCGWAAVPEGRTAKAVFFHHQDDDMLRHEGSVYLAWSGDGRVIADAMTRNGLAVEWDGTPEQRILVSAPKGARR